MLKTVRGTSRLNTSTGKPIELPRPARRTLSAANAQRRATAGIRVTSGSASDTSATTAITVNGSV